MKDDSDTAMDRLLAGTLKARAGAPADGACLDADTVAAWADQGLDARERQAVEGHAAGCARCQALLAAMVTTMPAPAAAPRLRAQAYWWLAAAAPVAAALVIWFAVPQRVPLQRSETAETAAEQAAPAAPATAASPVPPPASAAANRQADAPAAAAIARERRADASEQKTAAPGANAAASADAMADTAQPAPPAAANVASPTAAAAPPETPALREARSAPARVSGFASAIDRVIVSSNPSTRFRLLPGGGVQRSADGGATWRIEATGASDTLAAGASPSPSVCWLVGSAGTVLLSTDGRSWRRVSVPVAADLASVTAADADTATVTTVDGRAFATTDGGRTWSRPPDL